RRRLLFFLGGLLSHLPVGSGEGGVVYSSTLIRLGQLLTVQPHRLERCPPRGRLGAIVLRQSAVLCGLVFPGPGLLVVVGRDRFMIRRGLRLRHRFLQIERLCLCHPDTLRRKIQYCNKREHGQSHTDSKTSHGGFLSLLAMRCTVPHVQRRYHVSPS